MYLKKVILTNYRCYTKHEETFTPGLNLIIGSNGKGKTSIVEAISYAIFGNEMTRGKANSWIKEGCKHGKVELYIDDYIICRGDNEQWVKNSSGEIVARLNSGINQWVSKHFGLNATLYATSNYIAQKDIESFSSLQKNERIKRVEKLLKIDVLDTIKEKVKEDAKEHRVNVKTYSNALENVHYSEKEFKELKRKQASLLKTLNKFKEEKNNLLIKKGQYKSQLENWNKKLKLEKEIESIVYKDIPYTMEGLTFMETKLLHNKEVMEKINTYAVSSKNVKEKLDKKIEEYSSKKAEYDLIKDVKETCPTCGQRIPDAKFLLSKADSLKKELDILMEEGKFLRKQQEKYDLENSLYKEIPEQLETVRQMIIDKEKSKYLEQYEYFKNTEKPEIVDFSLVDTKIKEAEQQFDEINNKINKLLEYKNLMDKFSEPLKENQENLRLCQDFVVFIDKYRKEFTQNVIPLIAKNAKIIFDRLTKSKFPSFKITKDYSVENYDKYSGSEGDSANFAIRMAIAQVSRIKGFNTIILDEVASSFDSEKEKILLEILEKTNQQLIYISCNENIAKNTI